MEVMFADQLYYFQNMIVGFHQKCYDTAKNVIFFIKKGSFNGTRFMK